uniref:Secreted protein n=1 Tax=Fopius arisanus TaxID=64838 RepID=A0A0C9Q1R1_9HYME
MMKCLINIGIFSAIFACAVAQTVYIDLDTGKIVGVDQGRTRQPQQNYPPRYPSQQIPYYPHQPNQFPQQPPVQRQQNQPNTLNTEWVCTDPKTGTTMIIATDGVRQPVNRNQDKSYQDNPWLQNLPKDWNRQPNLDRPNGIQSTPSPIITTVPSTTSSTKAPFPSLDNFDWTQFLDKTTKQPPTDGEGILEPRGGSR